ncbi:hypothetical protein Q7C09_12230, partial [Heyndrickxia coagulans]
IGTSAHGAIWGIVFYLFAICIAILQGFAHLFHIAKGASSIIDKVVDLPLPDIFFKRGKGRGRVTSCKTADVHHGLICCKLISRRRCALTVAATQVYVEAPFCNNFTIFLLVDSDLPGNPSCAFGVYYRNLV